MSGKVQKVWCRILRGFEIIADFITVELGPLFPTQNCLYGLGSVWTSLALL